MKKTSIAVLLVLTLLSFGLKANPHHESHDDHEYGHHEELEEHEVHSVAHHETHEEESHEEHSADSDSDSVDEAHPNVSFKDNSDIEHMRNFQAISGDLKAYETEYLDCVKEIEDADFSEDRVDQCVGHNFVKVLVDIKYVTMKTMSQGDSKVREIFVEECYTHAFHDEEFLAGCDVMERDVLNMLWTGLSFVEILEINSDKYIYEYGRVPLEVWHSLVGKLNAFSKEFFELIDEIDSHKEVTILRLKNYIDDRIKMIAEAEGETPDVMPEPHEVTHTLEVTEETLLDADRKRKLLPALQIGRGTGPKEGQNRYVNAQAAHANDNKKLYDKPQTPGVYLFGRMAAQRNNRATFGGPRPKLNLQVGREAFRNIDFSKFKAK